MTDIIPALSPATLDTSAPAGVGYSKVVPAVGLEMIRNLINGAWTEAQGAKAEFTTKFATALDTYLNMDDVPHVTAGSVTVPTITAPAVSIPATQSAGDILGSFDDETTALIAEFVSKFTSFRTTYFNTESDAYSAAESWLKSAIANTHGLPPSVVSQLMADDFARITAEKQRASDAVIQQFAARRFPMPPGAAASAVMQIEQKSQDAMAEAGRKLTAMSVDLQKFNVEKILSLRGMAMDAATKYIAALADGPRIASSVVGIGYDAQSKLISAASDFYRADASAKDIIARVNEFNVTTTLEAATKNQAADLSVISEKARALLADCQMLAQMATALYNNLHVSSGFVAANVPGAITALNGGAG